MDLNTGISFYITNYCFDSLCYVELWHGEIKPKYKTLDNFKKEFKATFNKKYITSHFPNIVEDLIGDSNKVDTDELYEEQNKMFSLLEEFYPILKTQASGTIKNLTEEIYNEIVSPYIENLLVE
jgi:hypothetical protein